MPARLCSKSFKVGFSSTWTENFQMTRWVSKRQRNQTSNCQHLTCLLRNLYAVQEATVRTGHGTMDWFKIGKGVCQGCILSLCLFNLYAEYIMWNSKLKESWSGIKIARRNINNHRYTDSIWQMCNGRYTDSNDRKWRTKERLDEGERGEWKSWLETQHSKN